MYEVVFHVEQENLHDVIAALGPVMAQLDEFKLNPVVSSPPIVRPTPKPKKSKGVATSL